MQRTESSNIFCFQFELLRTLRISSRTIEWMSDYSIFATTTTKKKFANLYEHSVLRLNEHDFQTMYYRDRFPSTFESITFSLCWTTSSRIKSNPQIHLFTWCDWPILHTALHFAVAATATTNCMRKNTQTAEEKDHGHHHISTSDWRLATGAQIATFGSVALVNLKLWTCSSCRHLLHKVKGRSNTEKLRPYSHRMATAAVIRAITHDDYVRLIMFHQNFCSTSHGNYGTIEAMLLYCCCVLFHRRGGGGDEMRQ